MLASRSLLADSFPPGLEALAVTEEHGSGGESTPADLVRPHRNPGTVDGPWILTPQQSLRGLPLKVGSLDRCRSRVVSWMGDAA